MQKVVTVTSWTSSKKLGEDMSYEHEFPKLNHYLEHGYSVVDHFESTGGDMGTMYVITFILEN